MNYYILLENKIIRNIIHLTPVSVLLIFIKLNSFAINLSRNNKNLVAIKSNIKLAFPHKTQFQINAIAKKTTFEKLKYFLDLGILMHKSENHINLNIKNKITIIGGENLVEALASGKGVFLVSAHFACFYYFLLANIPELNEVNILKAVSSEGRETLYDKLERLTNKKINGIYIKDKFSSIRTYKKLKSQKLVACMFDNFLDDTTLVSANFLGYPALASAGVATLAIKSNAILLPAFIVRNETGYSLEFCKIIDSKKYCDLNINNQIVNITTDLNRIIENYITQYPEQWQAWTTLDRRWNLLDE